MQYSQEDFYGMSVDNNPKMPFYMTYPMQNVFMEEMEYEREMMRWKRMYPKEVRDVQRLVEEECDKMEYEGSLMFDETPDRLMLRQICSRIYEALQKPEDFDFEAEQYEAEQYEAIEAEELRVIGTQRPGRPPHFHPPFPMHPEHTPQHRGDNGLENLIEVLLFNEMHNRRCRHRRCRRWW